MTTPLPDPLEARLLAMEALLAQNQNRHAEAILSEVKAILSEVKRLHSRFDQVENFVAWFRKSNPLGGLMKGVIGGHSKK